jgi:hypothetical protein
MRNTNRGTYNISKWGDRTFYLAAVLITLCFISFFLTSLIRAYTYTPIINQSTLQASKVAESATYSANAAGVINPGLTRIITNGDAQADISQTDTGCVFLNYTGKQSHVLVTFRRAGSNTKEVTYSYTESEEWNGYALPFGPGRYEVTLLANDGLSEYYTEKNTLHFETSYFNEEEPYKYRNTYSYYEEDSALTIKAFELTNDVIFRKPNLPDNEKTGQIISYIYKTIQPDLATLQSLDAGETVEDIPSPEVTYSVKNGICKDRSGLAASMLKALGIPTKIVFGDVEINDREGTRTAYHSWIEVYFDGEWHMYDPSYSSTEIKGNEISGEITYLSTDKII